MLSASFAIGSAKQSVQSKQILGMAVGLIAMLVIAFLDYSRLLKLAWIGYLFVIVTLILVHFFGRSANGAARWLDLGFFDLQPSETAKILLILFYAQFIMKYREQFNTMRVLLLAVLFIIPPLILIYKQPNLSTTILVSVLFCVLMFVGGLSWKIIGAFSQWRFRPFLFFCPLSCRGTDADKAIISGIVLWHFLTRRPMRIQKLISS